MPVGGRMAGKTGYATGYQGQGNLLVQLLHEAPPRAANKFQFSPETGRSYNDINEEIYYLSIFMASLILLLICMALIYIAYEKYHKKREYFINV